MFGHGFRRAWYRWIANFNTLPTMSLSNTAVTDCRVQFCRLMVITNDTWCHFGARASLALEAWSSLASQWIYDTSQRLFVVSTSLSMAFGLEC